MGSIPIIYVEINQKPESSLSAERIEDEVESYIRKRREIVPCAVIAGEVLPDHVHYFRTCSNTDERHCIKLDERKVELRFCVYQNCSTVPQYDTIDGDQEGRPVACLNWALPNTEFEGLWESLILDDNIKHQLIQYAQTALLYSQSLVSPQIVRWNSVVLLHGPPGTGKTSLCKALAHKLSIRLSKQYKSGQLIEINTHSLFSKWYSESAKLVFKMFNTIKQWLEYEENFVCILMDEVESLIHSRQSPGWEPTESIRVVNTVLTQLDQLQRYKNFMVLATSNLTDAMDIAFVDRADLKLFLGYPGPWGVYEILRSCIEELVRCQLISGGPDEIFEGSILKNLNGTMNCGQLMTEVHRNSNHLLDLSRFCEGLSGRMLRKIPFLTSTKFIDKPSPNIQDFLIAMKEIVIKHKEENGKHFNGKTSYFTNGMD